MLFTRSVSAQLGDGGTGEAAASVGSAASSLRVVLPPALVASASAGQFGGVGPGGGFGLNGGGFGGPGAGNFGMGNLRGGNFGGGNFAGGNFGGGNFGGGGFAGAPGMGGFGGGAGGRGGIGMPGAGGFSNVPMTLPPQVGMVQVSNLIMTTTGERSSWQALPPAFGPGAMGGNVGGRRGFGGPRGGFGLPSIPATSQQKSRRSTRPALHGT